MAITSAMVSDLATVMCSTLATTSAKQIQPQSDNNICHQTNTQVTITSVTKNQGHNTWPHVNPSDMNNSGQNICHKIKLALPSAILQTQ